MKIAHITTAITGGAGIAALRLHEGLLKYGEGIDSYLIQKYPLTKKNDQLNVVRCTHFHPISYRLKNKLKLVSLLTKEGLLLDEINKLHIEAEVTSLPISYFRLEDHPLVQEADIIHLHWTSDFINYPRFFEKVKQPIVWTLHDMNPFQGLFHYEGDVERNKLQIGHLDHKVLDIKKKALESKSNIHVVCLSEWMEKKSTANTILSRYPHYLIPNGLDISKYPRIDKIEAKTTLGINVDRKTILFIAKGIDVPRKGLDLLLGALNYLDPDSFNLISVGEKMSNYQIGSEINYKHFGVVNSPELLNQIYSAADITALPSREDNLPNVMLESLMNGTPVICFSNGGMVDYIKNNETGILLNDISVNSLSEKLAGFIKDIYSFNSDRIRDYAKAHFSIDLQVKAYVELYDQILQE